MRQWDGCCMGLWDYGTYGTYGYGTRGLLCMGQGDNVVPLAQNGSKFSVLAGSFVRAVVFKNFVFSVSSVVKKSAVGAAHPRCSVVKNLFRQGLHTATKKKSAFLSIEHRLTMVCLFVIFTEFYR